jgi:general secretion pathway protein L
MSKLLAWWFDSLALLVPERWRRVPDSAELHLTPGWLVLRSFKLPAAARENLDGAVVAELDRVTPFTPDQVYLHYRANPAQGKEIPIDLAVVPRRLLDPLVTEGIARVVAPAAAPEWLRGRNFLTGRGPAWRPDLSRPVALVLLLALLLPGAAAFWRADHLQSRLADAQREASETLVLARQLAIRRSGLSPLKVERASRPALSLLLADLTRALPDGAYLDQLTVDGQAVSLSGYAVSAAALIPALAQDRRFSDAHFTGSVTREPERGLERFQIAVLYGGTP